MEFIGSNKARHLAVLVHGLWGNPDHLEAMAKALRKKKHSEENLHILVAKRNSGSFTYDGIETGGERLCQEIEEEIEKLAREGQEMTRISMIGYSLGGLVARYTIGLLHSKGIFEKVKPVNFTTFASPHLGVRSPLCGWHNHVWNVLGARTLSTSGRQLFTIDRFRGTGKPLLEILADPEFIFIKGLTKFERRTLYTNIVNDRSAVYYTTGIAKTDPFTNLNSIKINYLEGYEDVILNPKNPVQPLEPELMDLSFFARFTRNCREIFARLPLLLAMIIFIPFGVAAFLLNSGIQSFRSNRRIRLHEKGLAGIQTSNYRVPLLITGMRGAVEDVYESLNSAQSNEYLREGAEEDPREGPSSSTTDWSQSRPRSRSLAKDPEKSELNQNNTPILALAPYQFKMIQALDEVGWRKFPVHIKKVRHSHAAIILRIDKESYNEGSVVFRHWLDEEFIL